MYETPSGQLCSANKNSLTYALGCHSFAIEFDLAAYFEYFFFTGTLQIRSIISYVMFLIKYDEEAK